MEEEEEEDKREVNEKKKRKKIKRISLALSVFFKTVNAIKRVPE